MIYEKENKVIKQIGDYRLKEFYAGAKHEGWEVPEIPTADAVMNYGIKILELGRRVPDLLYRPFVDAVAAYGGDVNYNTPVKELLKEAYKAVEQASDNLLINNGFANLETADCKR